MGCGASTVAVESGGGGGGAVPVGSAPTAAAAAAAGKTPRERERDTTSSGTGAAVVMTVSPPAHVPATATQTPSSRGHGSLSHHQSQQQKSAGDGAAAHDEAGEGRDVLTALRAANGHAAAPASPAAPAASPTLLVTNVFGSSRDVIALGAGAGAGAGGAGHDDGDDEEDDVFAPHSAGAGPGASARMATPLLSPPAFGPASGSGAGTLAVRHSLLLHASNASNSGSAATSRRESRIGAFRRSSRFVSFDTLTAQSSRPVVAELLSLNADEKHDLTRTEALEHFAQFFFDFHVERCADTVIKRIQKGQHQPQHQQRKFASPSFAGNNDASSRAPSAFSAPSPWLLPAGAVAGPGARPLSLSVGGLPPRNPGVCALNTSLPAPAPASATALPTPTSTSTNTSTGSAFLFHHHSFGGGVPPALAFGSSPLFAPAFHEEDEDGAAEDEETALARRGVAVGEPEVGPPLPETPPPVEIA